MNEDCLRWVELLYPNTPEEHVVELLMCATAYPAGDSDDVWRQLMEARKAGARTWGEAVAFGNECMERDMQAARLADKEGKP